jgi:hypothetical protein
VAEALTQGRAAVAGRAWAEAYERLAAADREAPLAPVALEPTWPPWPAWAPAGP